MIFVSSVTRLEFRTWMIFDKRARLSFCVSLWPAGVRLPRCQRQTVSAVLSQGGEKDTLRYWKVQQAEGRHCRGTVAWWEFLGCKMSAVHTQSISIFCTLVLRFATAVSRPAFDPLFQAISLSVSSLFVSRWSWIWSVSGTRSSSSSRFSSSLPVKIDGRSDSLSSFLSSNNLSSLLLSPLSRLLPLVLHSALFPPTPQNPNPLTVGVFHPFFFFPPCFLLSWPKTLVRIASKNAYRGQEEWGEYQELEKLRADGWRRWRKGQWWWWWNKLDFMDMPQVCKELQREPTGTITPIGTQSEEESRVIDALSDSVCSQHAALYWPSGDSPSRLSKFTRKTRMWSPQLGWGRRLLCSPLPNTLLPRVLFEWVTDSHPS